MPVDYEELGSFVFETALFNPNWAVGTDEERRIVPLGVRPEGRAVAAGRPWGEETSEEPERRGRSESSGPGDEEMASPSRDRSTSPRVRSVDMEDVSSPSERVPVRLVSREEAQGAKQEPVHEPEAVSPAEEAERAVEEVPHSPRAAEPPLAPPADPAAVVVDGTLLRRKLPR